MSNDEARILLKLLIPLLTNLPFDRQISLYIDQLLIDSEADYFGKFQVRCDECGDSTFCQWPPLQRGNIPPGHLGLSEQQ